jgi:two-component system, OmpR family, phosphate regulon sensor histidine kinase PhoR
VVGVLAVLGVVLDQALERSFVSQLTDSLVTSARAVQAALPPDGEVQPEVVRLGTAMRVRITVIRDDGVVLADSEHDPATMENHRTRPEVVQALAGRIGVSSRSSSTVGIPFRYVALPPEQGRVVRVALPLTTVQSKLWSVRVVLALGFLLAAVAGIVVLAVIARGVSKPLNEMSESVGRLGDGDFTTGVPERGTEELRLLGRTLNRTRADLAAHVEAMARDRGTLNAILASLDEGVILFAPDGLALYQNPSAATLLGGSVKHTRNLAPEGLRRVVAGASIGPAREEIDIGGAAPRVILAAATTVPPDGNVLLVLRDVTEARRIEAVRRDFAANASHELKTPAASLQALAETISTAARDDPEAVPRFAGQLEKEAGRMARMVSDLLDLSRLEGEPGTLDEFRFDRLASAEAESHRRTAEAAGLGFVVNTKVPAKVNGSSRDLALMVRNLVENALHYTRPGGTVEVSVGADETSATLEVSDTGIGIPTRELGRVFERFYRVDRARSRETGGTGLGLSIVKHVAESHGGTVEVRSRLGEGTIFTVRLPLAGARGRQ